jgi:hypothetical protein
VQLPQLPVELEHVGVQLFSLPSLQMIVISLQFTPAQASGHSGVHVPQLPPAHVFAQLAVNPPGQSVLVTVPHDAALFV